MAVIAKHFPVEPESIKVKMERGDAVSTLEVEVEIPTPMCVNLTLNAGKRNAAKPNPRPAVEKVAAERSAAETPVQAKADPESLAPVELAAEAEANS